MLHHYCLAASKKTGHIIIFKLKTVLFYYNLFCCSLGEIAQRHRSAIAQRHRSAVVSKRRLLAESIDIDYQ